MEADIQVDMDQSPFPIIHTDEQQSQSQFSEELQLSGGSEESRWNWLAGVYYFRENADDRNQTLLASGLYDALGLLPAALIPLVPSVTCPSASPADPCAGGAGNPFNALLDLDVSPITSLTTDNWAAFGQATFQATDTFSITIGGRYSWERKEYFIDSVYPNSGRVASPPTTDEQTWTNFTPRIGVEYDVSDDVMAYASYSQGFKSGGWNPRPLTPEEFRGYDPETLNAYEVGFKSRLFDGRMTLNMAAFYSQYEDVQLQTNSISPTTGGLLLTVDNAGSVDIYGAELEILARPVRGLDLNLGVGYIENEYQSLAPGVGYSIDNQLPKTPTWSINFGAQYTFDLPDNYGELRIRADANHRSETFHDPANSPSIVQPGYTLVDARFAWSSPGDDYELAIFGKNLTDELYHTTAEFVPSFGFRNEVLGEPREWGVSLTRRF
jgi:iron complex outermembrane receptor protein